MQRVFHIPSHLSYASKLASDTFVPVPSPSGEPLRVADLLALSSWDFFDVLHLHTVELATSSDLISLSARLRGAGKGLVFTLHDLVPNIETDRPVFEEKTRLAVQDASSVITLTRAAADQVVVRFAVKPSIVPHGYAVPPEVVTRCGAGANGLFAFGALRPNRDLLGLVRAWCLLSGARLPLRILLRSLGVLDRQRYASELAELAEIARAELDLTVETTTGVLSPADLVDVCQQTTALVMPYRTITHSGQLEFSRDLGIAAVVPDVPTVRAQLSETAGDEHPCVWFPPTALGNPSEFAEYLKQASIILNEKIVRNDVFIQYRIKEHERLIGQYGAEYNRSCKSM